MEVWQDQYSEIVLLSVLDQVNQPATEVLANGHFGQDSLTRLERNNILEEVKDFS